MNINRINELKRAFEGKMPETTKEYTNKEVLEMLLNTQDTMLAGVYEQTHAEAMEAKDLMIHFGSLAEQYGLKETSVYQRFQENMKEMSQMIGRLKSGMKGEYIAQKNLKMLSHDKCVQILYNISLKNEDMQTEYDAIVIAPYGLFVVEVKNWNARILLDKDGILHRDDREDSRYNVLARMAIKETLLRECLGESFPKVHEEFLLFSREKTDVTDEYKKIKLCYGAGIVKRIQDYKDSGLHLTKKQIDEIAEKIKSCNEETRGVCKVKCDEIVEDYSILMAAIEDAAKGVEESVLELKRVKDESAEETMTMETVNNTYCFAKEPVMKKQKTKTPVSIAGVAAGFALGMLATSMVLLRK